MQAVLAEDGVLKILREHYVVVLDEHSSHNSVAFGVNMWIFSSGGSVIRTHWYGTGNAIIGMCGEKDEEARMKLHKDQVAAMDKVLGEGWAEWEKARAAKEEQR